MAWRYRLSRFGRRGFRWVAYVGFWWSLISLAYSMRTPHLALEKLAEWFAMASWVLGPFYWVWTIIRDVFVFVTSLLFDFLPFNVPDDLRAPISFGFFFGMRLAPWFVQMLHRHPPRTWFMELLAALAGFAALILTPYLLVCDAAQTWISLPDRRMMYIAPYGISLMVGLALWLAIDPFDFIASQAREEDNKPQPN